MRPQPKAPWLLIVVVAGASYAIGTAAQWAYPVKASPTPELNDRWRRLGEAIRQHPNTTPMPLRPGTGVPVVPAR